MRHLINMDGNYVYFAGPLFLHLWGSNFIQAGMDDLLARSRVIESDALPFGGEDDEHNAGKERHS